MGVFTDSPSLGCADIGKLPISLLLHLGKHTPQRKTGGVAMNSIAVPEPSLSSRAMLCSLSISMWSARKHDREASEEIAQRHGAQPDAGRYHKVLLPKATCKSRFFASLRMTWFVEGGAAGTLLHGAALG
jgi:hypothetical protein